MNSCTYLLKLEGDNYYIGETSDRQKLFNLDIKTKWTTLHKPIELVDCWLFDNKQGISFRSILTLHYMMKYGVDKVRGGGYSEVKLLEPALRNIANYHKHMKNCKSIEELEEAYKKVNEINHQIWSTTSKLGLKYYDAVYRFDNLETNSEFLSLNQDDRLTRSKKKRIFGDEIGFSAPVDNPGKRRKVTRK